MATATPWWPRVPSRAWSALGNAVLLFPTTAGTGAKCVEANITTAVAALGRAGPWGLPEGVVSQQPKAGALKPI